MIVIEKESKKPHEKIIDQAKKFFGPEGTGLTITSEQECCVKFEDSSGYVNVTVTDKESGKTKVEVESREWEHHAKRFLTKI